MLGLMEIHEALLEAERSIESDGITAFQIKGGSDPARDIELITRLRKAMPNDVFLRLDANKGYGRIPKEIADIARRLEAAGADALEQPASTVEGLAACRAATKIPIIADEACWTSRDVLDLWQARAVDGISVIVAKAGGMELATNVARTAALVGFGCDINGSIETGIGSAASLHVGVAAETLTLPSIVPIPSIAERHLTKFAGRYWEDDVVDGGYTYRAGYLHISDAPGLGITVNEKKLEKYSAGTRKLTER
jgi:muconate cycloisomerase